MVMLDSARPVYTEQSASENSASRSTAGSTQAGSIQAGSTQSGLTQTGPIQTGSTLEWEPVEGVQPAAWVGRVRGIFVGMVEARWQEGYTATSRLGRKLGTFGTLADAQDAFVIHHPARQR